MPKAREGYQSRLDKNEEKLADLAVQFHEVHDGPQRAQLLKEKSRLEKQIASDKDRLEKMGNHDERRVELSNEMRDLQLAIRNNEKQLDKLGPKTEATLQLQRYGLDQASLEQIFNTAQSRGSFSAYDVMRGGFEQNEVILELRTQTELLEPINENANTAQ